MRLSATRTGQGVLVAANEFLEFRATIVTNIFVNRHFSQAPDYSFSPILSHKLVVVRGRRVITSLTEEPSGDEDSNNR